MKKIIVCFSIFIGVVSQAATVTWDSSKMFTANDQGGGFSTTAIKGAATAYLFALTDTKYQSFVDAFNKSGNMGAVWGAYKDQLASATATGKTGGMSSSASLETSGNVGDKVYAAIIYTYTDAKYGDMYIANVATGEIGAEAGLKIGNLANYYFGISKDGTPTGGWIPGGTDPAPEPTSSMLLLLGAAGLALRRRRV